MRFQRGTKLSSELENTNHTKPLMSLAKYIFYYYCNYKLESHILGQNFIVLQDTKREAKS